MTEERPRRSRARWIIPLVLLFLFCCFVAGLFIFFIASLGGTTRIASGTILELTLRGPVSEGPDPFGQLFPGIAAPPSVFEIVRGLDRAAADDRVVGLKVNVDTVEIGWGAAAEIAAAIDRFRGAGKPVHAVLRGDLVTDVEYAMALAADHVWLGPQSSLMVNGFNAEVTFWRGTLDKLHVEPEFLMLREYKSAGEPMSRYEMSEYFRESIAELLVDILDEEVGRIVERRKIEPGTARAAIDRGMLSAREALSLSLVDRVGHDAVARDEMARAAGNGGYQAMSVGRYLEHAGDGDGARVAVVFGTGIIVASGSGGPFDEGVLSGPEVARDIRRAAADPAVKAILFRVDSPGGSAVGSDHVREAIVHAREVKKKPVVVSMSSAAASGGYWVSLAADAIVARPTTITGSIGVVFGKYNLRGLYELAGARVDTVKLGENADIFSLMRTMDEGQRQRVLAWMTDLYEEFKGHVGAARNLDGETVESIARGRVWSGKDALDRGLVDRLGGYEEAAAILRERLGLEAGAPLDLVIYPRAKTIIDLFLEPEIEIGSAALRSLRDPGSAVERALVELAEPRVLALAPQIRAQ